MVAFVSTFEGFGMPIVEAQRVGRAVLTSTVASMPEVAGGAACLVDPFDPLAIRAGVLRILGDADYRRRLVEQGFENAKRFEPQVIADTYAQIYREIERARLGDQAERLAISECAPNGMATSPGRRIAGTAAVNAPRPEWIAVRHFRH